MATVEPAGWTTVFFGEESVKSRNDCLRLALSHIGNVTRQREETFQPLQTDGPGLLRSAPDALFVVYFAASWRSAYCRMPPCWKYSISCCVSMLTLAWNCFLLPSAAEAVTSSESSEPVAKANSRRPVCLGVRIQRFSLHLVTHCPKKLVLFGFRLSGGPPFNSHFDNRACRLLLK